MKRKLPIEVRLGLYFCLFSVCMAMTVFAACV